MKTFHGGILRGPTRTARAELRQHALREANWPASRDLPPAAQRALDLAAAALSRDLAG